MKIGSEKGGGGNGRRVCKKVKRSVKRLQWEVSEKKQKVDKEKMV